MEGHEKERVMQSSQNAVHWVMQSSQNAVHSCGSRDGDLVGGGGERTSLKRKGSSKFIFIF